MQCESVNHAQRNQIFIEIHLLNVKREIPDIFKMYIESTHIAFGKIWKGHDAYSSLMSTELIYSRIQALHVFVKSSFISDHIYWKKHVFMTADILWDDTPVPHTRYVTSSLTDKITQLAMCPFTASLTSSVFSLKQMLILLWRFADLRTMNNTSTILQNVLNHSAAINTIL